MLLGTSNRAAATEFAFLVGIPTMYAASAYSLLKEFKDGAGTEDWTGMGIAFVVSMVTAFVAVKWLLAISAPIASPPLPSIASFRGHPAGAGLGR